MAKIGDRFAERARARRQLLGMSQADVARKMRETYGFSWHQTVLAKIEGGQRTVRLDEAFALCRLYGIELDDLLRGRNLDSIRNGHVVIDVEKLQVRVIPASSIDPDAEFVSVDSLRSAGEERLRAQVTSWAEHGVRDEAGNLIGEQALSVWRRGIRDEGVADGERQEET